MFFLIAWEPKSISLVIEEKNKKRTSENRMAKISPQ